MIITLIRSDKMNIEQINHDLKEKSSKYTDSGDLIDFDFDEEKVLNIRLNKNIITLDKITGATTSFENNDIELFTDEIPNKDDGQLELRLKATLIKEIIWGN